MLIKLGRAPTSDSKPHVLQRRFLNRVQQHSDSFVLCQIPDKSQDEILLCALTRTNVRKCSGTHVVEHLLDRDVPKSPSRHQTIQDELAHTDDGGDEIRCLGM